MSIFKTRHLRAVLALCCMGVPPPGLTQASPEAPWDDSPAPFVLHGESVDVTEDRRIARGLQLESASEAAAAPVKRRTVRRVIFIGKTSCKKRIGAARQNAKAGKKFAGAARRGAHCRAVKRSALQTDLI